MPTWPQSFGYCTEAHVLARAPFLAKTGFSTTSVVTLAQVEGWITEVAYLIDARANRQGFSTPATIANGYTAATVSILQTWSSVGVAAMAVMATENKTLDPGARTTGQIAWASFLKWLNDDEAITTALDQSSTQAAGFSTGIADPDPITGAAAAPIFSVSQRF